MTNTEAYKARIEAAGSRDALQAIETEVRKDRGLTFGEKEAILRACEGRDYILRNRAEAWAVMNILFFRVKAEMDAYRDLSGAPQSWTPDEIAEQRTRFISLWKVIEEAELAGEYEAWQYAGCPTAYQHNHTVTHRASSEALF